MAREPESIEEQRRALGELLAVFRKAANLTQGQLADAAFHDRTKVTHIENGRARADERFWQACDDAVEANGILVTAFHDLEAAKQAHQLHEQQTRLAQARARANSLSANTTGAQGSTVAGTDASSVAYALGVVESGQPDGFAAAVDALKEVVAFASDRLATAGPASVQADLLTARGFARALFEKYKPVGARAADIQVVAAWLSSLLAVASSYAGNHGSALVWALDAQNRGQAAGHPVISGWALLTRATISHYQGHAARSLDLARQGTAVAPVGTVAFAKLTCQQMRSYASLGDTDGMQFARRRAQAATAALNDENSTGVHSIARAAEPPYTAASLLLVGEYAESSTITEDLIVTAYPEGHARETSSYARTLLVLAMAQAGLGKLDEAAATGTAALSVPGTVWPTVVLAGKLDRALTRSGDSQVAEVLEFAGLYRDAARDLAASGGRT